MKGKMMKRTPLSSKTYATGTPFATFAALVAACSIFSACSDDSSTSQATPLIPEESSGISSSSGVSPDIVPISSFNATCDALIPECGYSQERLCSMGISEYCVTDPQITPEIPEANCTDGAPVQFPMDQFNDIGEVYKSLQCNEKVIFILRHAERDASTAKDSPLTLDGAEAAVATGQKLAGSSDFKFVFSGFLRTYQTAYYISIGRGQYQPSPAFYDSLANWQILLEPEEFVAPTDFAIDTLPQLADGWYLKDKELRDQYKERDSISNVNQMYSKWIYEGMYEDVFYDLEERSKEIVFDYIVKDYSHMPKYTLMASHDQLLMPLTSWATEKQINLIFLTEDRQWRWLGYLAGIAIIVNDLNEVRYVPIRGMENGYGR